MVVQAGVQAERCVGQAVCGVCAVRVAVCVLQARRVAGSGAVAMCGGSGVAGRYRQVVVRSVVYAVCVRGAVRVAGRWWCVAGTGGRQVVAGSGRRGGMCAVVVGGAGGRWWWQVAAGEGVAGSVACSGRQVVVCVGVRKVCSCPGSSVCACGARMRRVRVCVCARAVVVCSVV